MPAGQNDIQMSLSAPTAFRRLEPTGAGTSRRAAILVWLALAFLLGAAAIGLGWDRRWHATHVFNSFYSPPHLFIYSMLGLTVLTVGVIVSAPRLRSQFASQPIAIPFTSWELPGALAPCAGGLGVVMLAGLFDDIWHSNFGLDETAWSFPHAMIGTGLQLTFMGILACRIALVRRKPLGGIAMTLLGVLLFGFSQERLVGPLANATSQSVQALANFPILVLQPTVQHTMRIYEAWNLNRTNALFVPMAALAAGAALALVWHFTRGHRRGTWIFLVAVLVPTVGATLGALGTAKYFGIQHDPRSWLPIPFLPSAVALLALRAFGVEERWAWAGGGVLFGLCSMIWSPHLLLVPVAALCMTAGAYAGRYFWNTIASPTRRSVVVTVMLFGIGVPAITGVADLYLRLHSP